MGKLRCSEKTRRPGAGTVEAVAGVLDGGDFHPSEAVAAFAWPRLLQAGGLAQLTSGRPALTSRGQTALGADLLRVWPTCDFVRIESMRRH
jgi:hypothetical protein